MSKFLRVFEKFLYILVLVLLIGIPLLPKVPLFNVTGTFVAIRVDDFLVAFALGSWGLYILLSRRVKEFFQSRLNLAIMLFLMIGILSVFSGAFLTETIKPHLGLFHLLRRFELLLLLPLAVTAIKTQRQVKIALFTLSIVTFLVCIYALGQQYLHWPVISTTNSEFSKGQILVLTPGGRVNSTFAGHYDLAVFLMMVLSILAAMIFTTKNIFMNVWYLILGTFSAFILVLTAARFSFFAAVAGIISAFLLGRRKILIGVTLLAVVAILIYPSQLRDRLISTITINLLKENTSTYSIPPGNFRTGSKLNLSTLPASATAESTFSATLSGSLPSDIAPGEPTDPTDLGVYRSFEIRTNVEWPRAINAFLVNPFLGSGYSSLDLATDNDYLRSLGEVGILGTLAMVLIMIEIFKRVYGNFKSGSKFVRIFSVGILAMMFGFLMNAIFIDVFEASKVGEIFWLLIGLNIAIQKEEKND